MSNVGRSILGMLYMSGNLAGTVKLSVFVMAIVCLHCLAGIT